MRGKRDLCDEKWNHETKREREKWDALHSILLAKPREGENYDIVRTFNTINKAMEREKEKKNEPVCTQYY